MTQVFSQDGSLLPPPIVHPAPWPERESARTHLILIPFVWKLDGDIMVLADLGDHCPLLANDLWVVLGLHAHGQLEAPQGLGKARGHWTLLPYLGIPCHAFQQPGGVGHSESATSSAPRYPVFLLSLQLLHSLQEACPGTLHVEDQARNLDDVRLLLWLGHRDVHLGTEKGERKTRAAPSPGPERCRLRL